MGWTAPRTWVAGEVVTAALMNVHVRDNTRYLKGLDGAVTTEDDLTVANLITAGLVDGVDVAGHKARHQTAGADEVSIAGLLGESAELNTHKADTTVAHGAVSAATASKFVVRDASARAKFAAPNAAGDALIKGTRIALADMAALTTDKYWKGVGGVPAEADVPVGGSFARGTFNNPQDASVQAITGVGFQPDLVVVFRTETNKGGIAIYDGTTQGYAFHDEDGVMESDGIYTYTDGSNFNKGVFSALGADGFSITWTESGTAPANTYGYICIKLT